MAFSDFFLKGENKCKYLLVSQWQVYQNYRYLI